MSIPPSFSVRTSIGKARYSPPTARPYHRLQTLTSERLVRIEVRRSSVSPYESGETTKGGKEEFGRVNEEGGE